MSGPGAGFFGDLWHLTLPALALALTGMAFLVKHTRAAVIGVLDQDYLTFARARGLSPCRVLFVYALRNALIPVVTMSGLILSYVIVGAVLVEDTFSLPGIGQLLVQSAHGEGPADAAGRRRCSSRRSSSWRTCSPTSPT